MTLTEELALEPNEQVDFLIEHPDRLEFHWEQYVGIFNSVTLGCGCPVQLKEEDQISGITGVDRIFDGGDNEGNRIPPNRLNLLRRWRRAAWLPNTERIRRKILAPFLKIRELADEN